MYKRVNMICNGVFTYKGRTISGTFKNIVIDSECIKKALQSRNCKVEEIICPGKVIKLGFHNYNTDNGGDVLTEADDTFTKHKEAPKVVMCGNTQKQQVTKTIIVKEVEKPILKVEEHKQDQTQQFNKQNVSKRFDNNKQNKK